MWCPKIKKNDISKTSKKQLKISTQNLLKNVLPIHVQEGSLANDRMLYCKQKIQYSFLETTPRK